MLESMRQRGASIFIYLIFGVLIAGFVITFGPQQGQGGCRGVSNTVVDVDGTEVNLTSYRIAYSNPYNPGRSRERVYFALESLIRRELLAQAAEERGLRVTGDMVDEEIKKGFFFIGGLRIPLGENIFDLHDDGTRTWNVLKFKRWVANLDVKSTSTYRDEQVRGMQAALMHELLTASARVSREEALADFLHSRNTVTYDLVRFDPAAYRAAMRLDDAAVQRYLAAHEADVKARYQQDERLYKGLKPQLKLRQIFIATAPAATDTPTDKPADAAGSAAGSGAGSAVAATPAPKQDEPKAGAAKPLTTDEAKAKLEAARTAVSAGKQKFADAAKQLATSDADKASGGDLGWRGVDNPQLGDKAVNDAVKALKPGEMTPVITTDAGAYLVIAEDKREGDLAFDQVKHEIATELARDAWGKEAAKRAALAALDAARAGTGKNLDQLFEREAEAPAPNLDFLNDPNMPDEQKQMILDQLRQQMQGGRSGSTWTWEGKDQLASWKAQADGAGGSATPATPAAGSAAPAKPATGSAAPATPATGSAAPATPAAGSAAAPTPTTTTPAAGAGTAIPPVEATTDQLPAFGDVPKPKVAKLGPESRQAPLPGLSKELTPVLFDELSAGMLAKRVYEVDGAYVLVQLTAKGEAKVEDFDKEADRYISRLQTLRSYTLVEEWLEARCNALAKDQKIVPAKELVAESDDKGNPVPQIYRPCMYADSYLSAMIGALR